MFISLIILAACGMNNTATDLSESNFSSTENVVLAQVSSLDSGGDFEVGIFRPIFYSMPAPFLDLVGRDTYFEWVDTRSYEERENECIAVSFVRYFNVSKENFNKANEELRQIWANVGASSEDGSVYELYHTDLIYTFDNEKINEFFLWENSIYAQEIGLDRNYNYTLIMDDVALSAADELDLKTDDTPPVYLETTTEID